MVAMLTGRRIHTTKLRIPYWIIGHLMVLGKSKETKRGESIKRGEVRIGANSGHSAHWHSDVIGEEAKIKKIKKKIQLREIAVWGPRTASK